MQKRKSSEEHPFHFIDNNSKYYILGVKVRNCEGFIGRYIREKLIGSMN